MLFQMELRSINTIIFTAIVISTAYCQLDDMQEIVFPSSKKYCGSHLSQALSTICRGFYNPVYKINPSKKMHKAFLLSNSNISSNI